MGKNRYCLKKKEETNELHLFIASGTAESCYPESKSICKKMLKSESIEKTFNCKSEEEARTICARLGRQVCGTCVSSLYSDY
jgi:hypothetical protein